MAERVKTTGRARPLALAWVLLLAACGAADPGAGGVDDTVAAEVSGDTVISDVSTDISVDAVTAGTLVLGSNAVGETDPSAFWLLEDGDALEVQLGFQGLWMVVLAFKTRDLFSIGAPLFLTGELTVDGESQGTLALTEQRTAAGGDGWGYYYNFFLVVDDPHLGGRAGAIHFTARDAAGHSVAVDIGVSLTGGE